MTSITQLFG